jgi:Ca2+/H+ antiporter, TMEM165/GDT1 family
MMSGTEAGVASATFAASFVECVEALTIVLAMGTTRGWRSALSGAAAAVGLLTVVAGAGGYALPAWVPESALKLIVGGFLLVFGLQWLRKAVLRSAGLKALHDESDEFAEQAEAARTAGHERRPGLDWFGFVVSFKGVFLEGVEVVLIVLTFGANADAVPLASAAALTAALAVAALGIVVHRPLARVPENTLKYGVGLLLSTFGTLWAVEGLGTFRGGSESLSWPGGDLALLVVLAGWIALSRALVLWAPVLARTRGDAGSSSAVGHA